VFQRGEFGFEGGIAQFCGFEVGERVDPVPEARDEEVDGVEQPAV